MAAIFQIRRGDSSNTASLHNGELYLNTDEKALQLGTPVAGTPIKLVSLDTPSFGDIILSGSAYISGNIALGGNIYLGDNLANDTVNVNSPFSGSIVPSGSNVFDLGTSTTVYRNIYANNISSSTIDSLGNVKAFSASLDLRLDYLEAASSSVSVSISNLNLYTESQDTRNVAVAVHTSSMETRMAQLAIVSGSLIATASNHEGRIDDLELASSSVSTSIGNLNLYTQSQDTRNIAVAVHTSSIETRMAQLAIISGSLISTASNHEGRIDELELASSSVSTSIGELNSYSQSLKTAIELTGSSITVLGNLVVKGTQTVIDSTTIQLGDNIIELNGSSNTNGGLLVKDPTGGSVVSGSLLWDSTNDYWKGGVLGNESKILLAGGDNILSSSFQTFDEFSSSVDSRLDILELASSSASSSIESLNRYTQSQDTRNSNLAIYTGSVETRFIEVGVVSGSLLTSASVAKTTNDSQDISISNINTFSASALTRLSTLEVETANLETFSASTLTRLTTLETDTANLELFSSSQLTQNNTLATYTTSVDVSLNNINTFSSSALTRLTSLEVETVNLELFSASINYFSASIFTDFSNSYDAVSESFDYRISILDPGNISASFGALNAFTSSATIRLHNLELFTSSIIDDTFEEIASSTHTLVSGSSQIVGILSDLNSFTSSINTTIKTKLDAEGVLSGSNQVLGGTNIVSASTDSTTVDFTITNGNITANLIGGVVSGSSQILGGSTIHSSSIGDYQFNSIGVGTAASTTAGEIRATGDITAYYSSDIRLKENITPIPNALEKVNQISGNTYDWKEGYDEVHSHKGNDVGVIAQEIEQILPQIVTNRDSGFKAVQYEKIIPLLIEAIKELSAKVDRLENK